MFLLVIGWVVVMGLMLFDVWILFVIIFFWILLYFWVFSLVVYKEYEKVGVFMLLVISGVKVIW